MGLNHLAYFTLMMSFFSLWVHRSAWLWGGFFATSYIVALNTSVAQPFSLVPVITLLILFWLFKKPIDGPSRFLLVIVAIMIGAGLNFHWIPGFCNWHVTDHFWVNYDKPLMGLFALAFPVPLVRSSSEWVKVAVKAVPLTLLAVFLLASLALSTGILSWRIEFPSYFLLRLITNLFFVVIPEEAFFRGFVQEELFKGLGQGFKGGVGAVIAAAALFALFHVGWYASFSMLGLVFLAGLLYGTLYQYVRAVEASIVCHLTVNLLLMVFFNYHVE